MGERLHTVTLVAVSLLAAAAVVGIVLGSWALTVAASVLSTVIAAAGMRSEAGALRLARRPRPWMGRIDPRD